MSYVVSKWSIMNLLQFFIIFCCFSYISCESKCSNQRTCGECIGYAAQKCHWCSENKNVTRCQPENETSTDWCKTEHIIISKTENTTKQDSDFSSTIQLRPLEMVIKARPGEDVNFTISYKPAEDFPLDVYFLMDYTYTMMKHVEMLRNQSMQIFEALQNLTKNVRLGVGSFVEKPGLPYSDVNVFPKNGVPAYVFKNHLSLTNNMTDFKEKIQQPKFGSNYDDAEAGLDALMQVMACEKQLGWRKNTKRIIVLATDNTYHSAGDGKMLGAFKPNDMKCHLVNNEYNGEMSLKYDYPSVSQINRVARNRHFLIIFAALKSQKDVYQGLSKQIQASSYAELKEESNIMEIIQEEYSKSISAIKIGHDASSSFRVTIDQRCENNTDKSDAVSPVTSKNCQSTPNNRTVQIPVTIRSLECSKIYGKLSTQAIPITFEAKNGISDKVIVHFTVDCQCECEKNSISKASRDRCNNNGGIQCGACKCDANWGGETCKINCSDSTSIELDKQCYPANYTAKCNGHGICECGKCLCTDGFTGEVCQYDPSSCDTGKNGRVCSGIGRGTCEYGECSCVGQWTGKACDCPNEETSLRQCTGPFSKKICSGHGRCKCGTCYCDKKNENERYTGAFCDICDDCAIERCHDLEGYAKCNHNKTKAICDKEFALSADINLNVQVKNKSELIKMDRWTTGTQCRTELDDKSILVFKYNADTKNADGDDTDSNKMLLMIQKEVEIPPKADILLPIASVIAAILLIGLLTVVFWKVLVEWYDKREYNKFCNEAKAQGYDIQSENPLYEPPTQTFMNPTCEQSNL